MLAKRIRLNLRQVRPLAKRERQIISVGNRYLVIDFSKRTVIIVFCVSDQGASKFGAQRCAGSSAITSKIILLFNLSTI